jgi:hypothetical protein
MRELLRERCEYAECERRYAEQAEDGEQGEEAELTDAPTLRRALFSA